MKKGEWILKKDGAEWKPIGALLRNVLETNQEGVRPVRLEANHFCPPATLHSHSPSPSSWTPLPKAPVNLLKLSSVSHLPNS